MKLKIILFLFSDSLLPFFSWITVSKVIFTTIQSKYSRYSLHVKLECHSVSLVFFWDLHNPPPPPPPPHQKSNGPPLTENAWSCVIEIWIRGFGVLKERLSEGLRFVVWPRLNYKTKTSSVSRLLASDKAFERGSSFCSLTRPKLQNEDPVGFASFGVRQSVWARVFVL